MARFEMMSVLVWLWAAPAAAEEAPQGVRVHLVSDAPVLELRRVAQQFVGMGMSYRGPTVVSGAVLETLCVAPCDTLVDPMKGRVYVWGPGLTPSEEFSLARYRGDVTVKAKTGKMAGFAGGMLLMTFGSLAFLAGGTLTTVSFIKSKNAGLRAPGLITTGVSIPMVVGGAFLFGNNQTHVTIKPAEVDELP